MFQRFKEFMTRQRDPGEVARYTRLIGRIIITIGISFIVSYFVCLFLKDNWINYHSFIKGINVFDVVWILSGFVFVFIGISFVGYLGSEEKMVRNIGFLKLFHEIFPYMYVFFTVILLLSDPLLENNPEWILENFNRRVVAMAFFIYCLLTICTNAIINTFKIFKFSIPDSKDRLTIIITIFATIISAIALFK